MPGTTHNKDFETFAALNMVRILKSTAGLLENIKRRHKSGRIASHSTKRREAIPPNYHHLPGNLWNLKSTAKLIKNL